MDVQTQINNICDVCDKIKLNRATILVGDNGSGKSVVRKQLGLTISEKTENPKAKVKQVSMESRTGVDFAGMHFLADQAWEPTSCHTYQLITGLFASCFDKEANKDELVPYYFVIDELEIGMSRESQLAICNWIKEKLPEINKKSYGLLIITHSEYVVEQLKDVCDFIDLNNPNRTVDNWINREIIPTNFEQLEEDTNKLFKELLPKKNK